MEAHSDNERGYIPGVCNIGPGQRRRRLIIGWLGLIALIVGCLFLHALHLPSAWRLVLFLPATISAAGFLQYRLRFCAAFGLMALLDLSQAGAARQSVAVLEWRQKDRRRALQIMLRSAAFGAAITLAAILLP